MNDPEVFQRYLLGTSVLLIEFAREAKRDSVLARGTDAADFRDGYLCAFHRVITLMQQQACAYGLEVSDVGLAGIDEAEII